MVMMVMVMMVVMSCWYSGVLAELLTNSPQRSAQQAVTVESNVEQWFVLDHLVTDLLRWKPGGMIFNHWW